MTILANGTESLPLGLTPAAAYGIINTALQKIASLGLLDKDVPFFGLPCDGEIRGTSQIAFERLITAVEIRAEGAAPVGSSLIVQLIVGGVLQSQQYPLAATVAYALVAVTGDGNGGSGAGLVVPANTTLAVQITNGNQAVDVVVCPKSQLRIL
jgi:hypothetical protein